MSVCSGISENVGILIENLKLEKHKKLFIIDIRDVSIYIQRNVGENFVTDKSPERRSILMHTRRQMKIHFS